MQNNSFKDIMKLEINITNKLLEYMHSKINIMDILDELDVDLTYIQDERNSLAFNIWLSVDYIDQDGKTFIKKFMEETWDALSQIERDILMEKADSYVSLFEILSFDDDHVVLKDILNNEEYRVLEPSIHNVIETGEFLFTRIGNVLNRTIFMGDINYVPSLVKDLFLEELLIDYNMVRKNQINLTMVEYLKMYSLNLYKIYNESLINVIDSDGDINSYVFDELDEFEMFLLNKYKDIAVKKHLFNLTNIFEYALADHDMTLYDINRLDLNDFFSDAIEDGFINSHEEFNSYIATLKNYLQFLSIGDSQYKDSYSDILKISKNRFQYMDKLDVKNSFNLDKSLGSLITFSLNDEAMDVLLDYDKFILYISDTDIKLTSAKKHLRREDLLKLNSLFENSIVIDKKAPNQRDFTLINLFFNASLNFGVIEIQGNHLVFNKKGLGLLRLGDEEKYTLLIQYLWSKDFIKDILVDSDTYFMDILRGKITEVLSDLKVDKKYPISELLHLYDLFYDYHGYLLDLGLIQLDYDNNLISITSLGKKVFNYINQKKNMIQSTEIIKLDDFKRAKNNVEG